MTAAVYFGARRMAPLALATAGALLLATAAALAAPHPSAVRPAGPHGKAVAIDRACFPARTAQCAATSGGPESPDEMLAMLAQRDMRHAGGDGNAYASAVAERQAIAATSASTAVPGGSNAWAPAGQTPLHNDDPSFGLSPLGYPNLSGRVTAYAVDPDPAMAATHYYLSTAGGGVWETTDAATTWHPVGDGLPIEQVGALAYTAAGGTRTLIAGTGDNSFGYSSLKGLGVYVSSDNGSTWTAAPGVPSGSMAFKIAIDPTSPATAYVATDRGLYRSTNIGSGSSFVNVVLPTTCTDLTLPACTLANVVTDVDVRAGDAGTGAGGGAVIAAVGWRAATQVYPDGTTVQAPQNGIYVSADGTPGSFAYVDPSKSGFAGKAVAGRTSLAVAKGPGQSRNIVYALVQDAQKLLGCLDILTLPTCNSTAQAFAQGTVLDGAYYSADFGHTWTKVMNYSDLQVPGNNSALTGVSVAGAEGYRPGIQSWYNNWIAIDPTVQSGGVPSRVLFGLEEIWENTLQGLPVNNPSPTQAWKVIARYWNSCGSLNATGGLVCNGPSSPIPGTTTHPDQHAAVFVPDVTGGGVTLITGSDGGSYRQHIAAGSDFSNDGWAKGNDVGLNTLQPYDAEMSADGTIVAGLQDNGQMRITPGGREDMVYGGDGFFTTIDPQNSQNINEEYTYGKIHYSNDGGKTWNSYSLGFTSSLFATPLAADPTDPKHFISGGRQVYEDIYGYNDIQSCVDPACTVYNQTWSQVYDLGTAKHRGSGQSASAGDPDNSITAVTSYGPNSYVGFCGYCFVLDKNQVGGTFASGIATNVGGSGPPKKEDPSGWHIAAANGLPSRVVTSIAEDPSNANTVYVTLGGYARRLFAPGSFPGDVTPNLGGGHLYVSTDHGENFTDISGNLPNAPAQSVLFHNGQLIVATDVGVFVSSTQATTALAPVVNPALTYTLLGTGLPNAPVNHLAFAGGNPDVIVAATDGHGVYLYNTCTGGTGLPACTPAPASTSGGAATGGATAGSSPAPSALPFSSAPLHRVPWLPAGLALLGLTAIAAAAFTWRRRSGVS